MGKSKEQITGQRAESYCAALLREQGYVILEKNYTWQGVAEIDLIALRDDKLLFIEVKARRASTAYGGPAAAITRAKRRRLSLGVQKYVLEHGLRSYNTYLVAALIELSASSTPESCRFVEF